MCRETYFICRNYSSLHFMSFKICDQNTDMNLLTKFLKISHIMTNIWILRKYLPSASVINFNFRKRIKQNINCFIMTLGFFCTLTDHFHNIFNNTHLLNFQSSWGKKSTVLLQEQSLETKTWLRLRTAMRRSEWSAGAACCLFHNSD